MSDSDVDHDDAARSASRPHDLSRRAVLGGGLTLAGAAGLFSRTGLPAVADTTSGTVPAFPPRTPSLQPGDASGLQALLDYDPAKDPVAKYVRSRVPLAPRINPDRATQANPRIDPRPQILNIERHYFDVGNPSNVGDLLADRYGHEDGAQVARTVTYVDITNGWNGAQNVINAAYVDRAHRNGILALGVLFCPLFVEEGSDQPSFLSRAADGSFPAGDKLVDLAHYFGYDGYFLNIERFELTAAQAADLAELFRRMRSRAADLGMQHFYLQIYDSRWYTGELLYEAKLDEHNSGWITPEGGVDSLFVNYNWPINFPEAGWDHPDEDFVAESMDEVARLGIDPFQKLFFGMEYQLPGDGVHASPLDAYGEQVIPLNGDGEAKASLALFVSTDTFHRLAGSKRAGESNSAYLERVWQEERKFWSGPSGNPAVRAEKSTATAVETAQRGYVPKYGFANFIAERSVVGALPFTTRFNVGRGDSFSLAGRTASDTSWFDVGISDVLPTWQFWTRRLDTGEITDGLLSADFDSTVGYDGPSSLQISGTLSADNPTELRLFKTDLAIGASTQFALTYREGTPGAGTALRLGLITSDGNSTSTTWHTPGSVTTLAGGWRRVVIVPGARRIAAISLGFAADEAGAYKINIGELSIRDAGTQLKPPAAPLNFRVDGTRVDGDQLTVGFSWTFSPDVWYYDLRQGTGASTRWIGRISSDCYLAGLPTSARGSTVHLVAVNKAGVESAPASVRIPS